MSMAEYPSIRALMARHSTLWLCSAVFVAYVASHFQIYDAVQNLQGQWAGDSSGCEIPSVDGEVCRLHRWRLARQHTSLPFILSLSGS
jgi:hypothetical protein